MAATRKSDDETDISEVTEPLQAEMKALRSDLNELGSLVTRIGRKRASGLKSAAGSAAQGGYVKGEEALDDILGELKSLEDELAEATRQRPFAALGLAALIGFLFGVFFRR